MADRSWEGAGHMGGVVCCSKPTSSTIFRKIEAPVWCQTGWKLQKVAEGGPYTCPVFRDYNNGLLAQKGKI